MSYVNLHANYPPASGLGNPVEEYEQCLTENDALKAVYQDELSRWTQQRKAFDAYVTAHRAWKKAADQRAGKAMGAASAYARAQNSYNAARAAWQERVTAYENARAYNRSLDEDDRRKRDTVERKYGVKFPADALCVEPGQRQAINRACEIASVKGLGYTFDIRGWPPCALAALNTCRPRKTVVHPGPRPTPPNPPAPPPPLRDPPREAADPGPKPPAPEYAYCKSPLGGGMATFGLIAVLAVGGGVLGYRAYKKRKKAT